MPRNWNTSAADDGRNSFSTVGRINVCYVYFFLAKFGLSTL
jgi:hypothetical protein